MHTTVCYNVKLYALKYFKQYSAFVSQMWEVQSKKMSQETHSGDKKRDKNCN